MRKEKDPKYLEFTKSVVENWKKKVEEVAKEKNLDIEKDWDKYVNDLKTIGLDHWLEVSQTCYDRMNK